MGFRRIDYLEGAKLLARKGIVANDATMMLAQRYATGWREGEIQMTWEQWLDEDLDAEDEADEDQVGDAVEDPTAPEAADSSVISTKRWQSSANSSQDSAPAPTGT